MKLVPALVSAVLLTACAGASSGSMSSPSEPRVPDHSADVRTAPSTVADLCERLRPALSGQTARASRYAVPSVVSALTEWGDPDAELFADEAAMRCEFATGDAALVLGVTRARGGLRATTAYGGPVGDHKTPGTMGLVGLWSRADRSGDRIRFIEVDSRDRLVHRFERTVDGDVATRGAVRLVDACPGGTSSVIGSFVVDASGEDVCYRIDAFEEGRRLVYTYEPDGTTWAWAWSAP